MNVPGQMSGQPAQMNLGGGRGLQQHQPLQVASCHLDMDPQFLKMRSIMHRNIVDRLMKTQNFAENQSLEKIADRLEKFLYRQHPTKADYYAMLKEPIDPHLQVAVRAFSNHGGHQRQQMSHQTPTSSRCGTMVPTPGSMSDGYQDPSINVLQNSMAISDSSVMCPVGMQRQVAHMIPTPGFSHHQLLSPNPAYSNGAGYLNGESNDIQQVHEQKPVPFSINQSSYSMQHLGTHVGSGVHSRILEDSSPYGLSDPQINGDMGLPGPNMQLPYRTVGAKEFMNLPPYGNSPEKPLQQEFICHLPRGTPTSSCVSGNFYGTVSSSSTPTGNQNMNAAQILSTSRMEFALLTSQTTQQPLQPKSVIKSEVLDQTENVNIRKSHFPYQHQQQNYFEPNHRCSQFVKESELGSCRDEQLFNQEILPYDELMYSDKSNQTYRQYVSDNNIQVTMDSQQLLSSHVKDTELMNSMFQRTMSQDAAEQHFSPDWLNTGCAMTPIDHKLSKLPSKGSEQATNKCYLQSRWPIMFIHANFCPGPFRGSCKSQDCAHAQEILKHSNDCQVRDCLYGQCKQSKEAIYHYNNCVNKHCLICREAFESLSHYCDQTSKQNTIERSINGAHGDRMGINMVAAETFDDQPPISKRLRLQPMPPNVFDCDDAYVPQACPNFVSQQAHPKHLGQDRRIFPKQEQNIEIDIQPPQRVEIIGSGTIGKTSAIQSYEIPGVSNGVSNELDSHIKKENWLPNKDTNESALDIKDSANGSTNAMMPNIEKTKRKGISLMELFTPDQIYEHVRSLRQWVGQSKAKAEKNQVIGHSENLNSCQLCKVEKLFFEPPPKYCSSCGARIKRNAPYYSGSITESGSYYFCVPCYSESRSESILVNNIQLLKTKLAKKRNDDELEEAWVACDKCKRWQHQICALFNAKRNDEEKDAEYICHSCYIQEIENGMRTPLPQNTIPGAKDLQRTVLSDHIEERLFQRLKEERQNRANKYGKKFDEVPGAEGLVVRVVSSVDKKLEVKPHFLEIFREENYPAEFPYRSKAILLFQRIEGVEVCLFGMYVQEFGAECAFPNQRWVYLSYLDSVKYFRPEIETVSGEALRTFVYHEILIGYLQYCKQRGFTSCYIWACPPFKGEDYIMYCHPEIQKTPKSDKLREWYLSMLRKATNEGIVVELTNLYEHFFNPKTDCKAKVTAARLPYFDGDYWPGAAEDIINQICLPEDDRNLQKKGKLKKTITKRSLKLAGITDLSGNASKDAMLMQKLGEAIYPMKEDLITVHLQYSCHHCCIPMVSGRRWVCNQCKSFYICDKCYNVEEQHEEKERHPSNSTDFHILHPVEIDGVPKDTKDRDGILESEFFDTRQAFLSLCQGNHYQYDTLRGAKHSSMMVLYHLHNPTEPAFVTTCDICKNDIRTGQGWRCKECDYDECAACYKHNEGANHVHKLTKHPAGSDMDAQQKKSVETTEILLQLLAHAGSCPARGGCHYPNCRKLKSLFHHGAQCKIRSSGGCRLCKKVWSFIQLHARVCKESQCNMPRCRDQKELWRKLQLMQWQSESRRRAAVNQMMMQRQLESSNRAAGNGVNV